MSAVAGTYVRRSVLLVTVYADCAACIPSTRGLRQTFQPLRSTWVLPHCSIGLTVLITFNKWLLAALEEEEAAEAEVGRAAEFC